MSLLNPSFFHFMPINYFLNEFLKSTTSNFLCKDFKPNVILEAMMKLKSTVVKGAGYLPSIFTKCHPSHIGLTLNRRQGIPRSFLLQHSRNLSELITPELTQTLAG